MKRRLKNVGLSKLFAAAILALSFAIPARSATINEMHAQAWEQACVYKALNCKGLSAPQVQYLNLEEGMLGYHIYGTDVVVINLSLLGTPESKYIIIHEMVHYLQFQMAAVLIPYRFIVISDCLMESEAFNIVAAIAHKENFYSKYIGDWSKVRGRYKC